jgi:hypothetical protein
MHRDLGDTDGCVSGRALCFGRSAVTCASGLDAALCIQRLQPKSRLGPSPRGASAESSRRQPRRRIEKEPEQVPVRAYLPPERLPNQVSAHPAETLAAHTTLVIPAEAGIQSLPEKLDWAHERDSGLPLSRG